MDFRHSDDRQMLADTLCRYLGRHYPIAVRHQISGSEAGWSAQQWTALAELGVVGALVPEDAGGFGGGGFDIAVVFEALGRALVVEPFLGTMMAARLLARAGGQEALLSDVIAGRAVLAFAPDEPQSRYDLADVDTSAAPEGDTWLLTGAKVVVSQIEVADHILVSARPVDNETGAISLFMVERGAPGLEIRGYPLIDGGRGGELFLSGTPARLVQGDGLALAQITVAAGIVGLVWEAVGIMDVLKAATIDYLRTRIQFGVPIGRFQALQHRMATVALEIEQARSAAINAAAALDGARHDDCSARDRAISAAKYTIGRVGTLVAEEAIQMHGGIGMTWELPVSHYAKRLTMIGHQLGDEDFHLARYAALGRAA